jgi:hypothetical protein
MKLLFSSQVFSNLKNHAIGFFQRDNKHAPFIVCGINEKQEPMLECGYDAYSICESPQQAVRNAFIKVMQLSQR